MHSLEALLWIAETVEESVYARGSLRRVGNGLSFVLSNPPLRMGAFSAMRVRLNGGEVPPGSIRVRHGESPWRTAASIDRNAPLELRPGEPTEVAIDGTSVEEGQPVSVRFELQSIAIPPLVWLEFTEMPRHEVPA